MFLSYILESKVRTEVGGKCSFGVLVFSRYSDLGYFVTLMDGM